MEEVKDKVEEKKAKTNSAVKQEVVSMRQLLECGVHFGHQTKRWDPKMKKYIFTSRNGIHVIDLQQTLQLIHTAYEFIKRIAQNNGTVLFIGTKKQAQDAIKEEAIRCTMPFVNNRWLGGTLTNISTIRQRINKLKDLDRMKNDGTLETLSSKEQSRLTKLHTKLITNLEGITNMIMTPSALFIVDTHKEQLAIKEAKKLKIPIVGIVDTNANPLEIDYPIPANDDAIRAIKLLCSIISNAVIDGQQNPINIVRDPKKQVRKEEPKKEDIKEEEISSNTDKTEEKKQETKKEEKTTKKDAPAENSQKKTSPKAEVITEKASPAAKKPASTTKKVDSTKTAKTTKAGK